MNQDGDHTGADPGTPDEGRVVEDFFAAHRAQVGEEPVDEVTWSRIRKRASTQGGPRFGLIGGAAAAAAAAVIAGYVSWPLLSNQQADGPAGPTGTTAPATSEVTATESMPPSLPTEPVDVVIEVGDPAGLEGTDVSLSSLDPVGESTFVASGVAPCEQGSCSLVLVSTDDGSSWQRIGLLDPLAAAAGSPQATVTTTFLDADLGYAWVGGTVFRSEDGGATWSVIGTGDRLVHQVAVGAAGVAVVSTDQDGNHGSFTDLELAVTDHDSDLPAGVSLADGARVFPPRLLTAGEDFYAWTSPVSGDPDGAQVAGLWLASGTQTNDLSSALGACAAVTDITAAADGSAGMALVCRAPLDPTDSVTDVAAAVTQQVWRSDTGGRTWAPVGETVEGDAVTHPMQVASLDGVSMVRVAGGDVQVSSDGGQTWQVPASAPMSALDPETTEVFTGEFGYWLSATAERGYVLIGRQIEGGQGVFWTSEDGSTWQQHRVRP